jgi:16S rRNA (guanine(527)-N(7))-methyltransferase RsmG
MRSESDGGAPEPARKPRTPTLPPGLQADYQEFLRRVESPRNTARISQTSVDTLRAFGALVYERSARLSLVAEGDRRTLYTRHILDSLNPLPLFTEPPASALDVGSGAGFPGIPLAVVWPETRVILLESRERKAGFLETAVRELGLRNVRVVCARLEDHGRGWHAGEQAAAFIRAVGDLPGLLRSLAPICAEGARWVYFLGSATAGETLIRDPGGSPRAQPAETVRGAFGGQLLTGIFGRS